MASNSNNTDSDEGDDPSFREMGLDDRLLEAAAVKLGWKDPTDIQQRAIPLILEGRDLMARGRTGSGKTGAFVIPVVQKILDAKRIGKGSNEQCVRALIMAPTKELCRQIQTVLKGIYFSSTGVFSIGAPAFIYPMLKRTQYLCLENMLSPSRPDIKLW